MFCVGELVEVPKIGGEKCEATVVALDSDDLLVKVRYDGDCKEEYFPLSSLRKKPLKPKRKVTEIDGYEHGGLYYDYPLGSMVTFLFHSDGESELVETLGWVNAVKVGEWIEVRCEVGARRVCPQHVRPFCKKSKADALIPPWLRIGMEYLGPAASWVECHVLERSWMLHTGDFLPHFQAANDQKLIDNITHYFRHKLNLDLPIFWTWLRSSAVFTGSAILALTHGLDPFESEWRSGDIDIFTNTFGYGLDEGFGILWYAKGQVVRTPNRGEMNLKSGSCASRIDADYTKFIGECLETRKYRLHVERKVSLQTILNVTQVRGKQDKKQKVETNKQEKEEKEDKDEEKYLSGGRIEEGESLHNYCLRCFDLDVLCMTFNGNELKIGDGSMGARDRLASLTSTFQVNPTKSVPRTLERCQKYLLRGVHIQNLPEVLEAIGKSETDLKDCLEKNITVRRTPR